MADAPSVEPVLLEVWKGVGNHPACGIGESVTTANARAIANAVHNAIGVRINSSLSRGQGPRGAGPHLVRCCLRPLPRSIAQLRWLTDVACAD